MSSRPLFYSEDARKVVLVVIVITGIFTAIVTFNNWLTVSSTEPEALFQEHEIYDGYARLHQQTNESLQAIFTYLVTGEGQYFSDYQSARETLQSVLMRFPNASASSAKMAQIADQVAAATPALTYDLESAIANALFELQSQGEVQPATFAQFHVAANQVRNTQRAILEQMHDLIDQEKREVSNILVTARSAVLTRGFALWLFAAILIAGPTLWFSAILQRRDRELAREREFFAIMGQMPQLMWMTNAEGRLTWVSQALRKSLKLGSFEAHFKSLREKIHPDDFESQIKVFFDALAARLPCHRQYRFRPTLTDDYRTYFETSSPIFGPDGEFRGYGGVLLDVTEIEKIRENVSHAEAHMRHVAEYLPSIAYLEHEVDHSGRHKIVTANENCASIWGISTDEALENFASIWNIVIPEDRALVEQRLQKAVETMEPFTHEISIVTPQGARKRVLVVETPRAVGDDAVSFSAFLFDATDLARAESARLEMETAFDSANTALAITDANGAITNHNQMFRTLIGIGSTDFHGASISLLNTPSEFGQLHRRLRAAVASGESWRGEVRIRRANSSDFPAMVTISVVEDQTTQTVRGIVVIADLSEITHSREQLRGLAASLALAEDNERRRIATELHDDILQSLGMLKINYRALLRKWGTDQGLETASQCAATVDDIIVATRNMVFDLSPHVLYELGLEEALPWLAKRYQKSFNLETDVTVSGYHERLDETIELALFKATRELMNNVVKHADCDAVEVRLRRERDDISLVVRDRGKGFDTAVEARDRAEHFGLFNVAESLSRIGAEMEVDSAVGRGTEIEITLQV